MSVPLNITTFINDINNYLISKKKSLPVHIPPMGNKGGAGCYIMTTSASSVKIEYRAKQTHTIIVTQKEYSIFEKRFNYLQSLKKVNYFKVSLEYVVSNYNYNIKSKNFYNWQNSPYNFRTNPLVPTIFKELGY